MKKKNLKSLSLNKTKISFLDDSNSVVGGSFSCTGPHCTISCPSACLCNPPPDDNDITCNINCDTTIYQQN